jgi:hypothetical protein
MEPEALPDSVALCQTTEKLSPIRSRSAACMAS